MGQSTILSGQLPAPTTGSFTTATTGGTLADLTEFYYRIVARDVNGGHTTPSTEVGVTTEGDGSTNTNTCTPVWTDEAGAVSYDIYGRSTGAELFMANVPQGTTSWTDDGSITPAGAMPTTNTTQDASYATSTDITLAAGAYGRLSICSAGPMPANALATVLTEMPIGQLDAVLGTMTTQQQTFRVIGPGKFRARRENRGAAFSIVADT